MESNNDDQTINSSLENEEESKHWLIVNDDSSTWLNAVSEVIDDDLEQIFDPESLPIEVKSDGYSALKIPDFEFMNKFLKMN